MTSITADGSMAAALAKVKELAEVRDGSGNVIGFFAPITLNLAAQYADAAAQAAQRRFDPEEIKRRLREERPSGSFSTLVQRLGKLTEESDRRRAAKEPDFTIEEVRAFLASAT